MNERITIEYLTRFKANTNPWYADHARLLVELQELFYKHGICLAIDQPIKPYVNNFLKHETL